MKLKNTTDWTDHFLRRMVAWCCRQIDMPVRSIHSAVFRRSRAAWGGCARYSRRQISVCVGDARHFPANAGSHEKGEAFADRLECLVAVTAHEAYHIAAHAVDDHRQKTRRGTDRTASSERRTCLEEMRVLRVFRANRDALLAEWSVPPVKRESWPKASVQERRALKAANDLARWQRKLKLAQTKCRKLKQRVNYYDKAMAAAQGPK